MFLLWKDGYRNTPFEELLTNSIAVATRRFTQQPAPENGTGEYVNDYQTSASIGAEILKNLAVPEDHVQMAASHVNGRDRTYETHRET